MKKFLTMLLALSVVFTYTVGTAFAATIPTASEQAAAKVASEQTAMADAVKAEAEKIVYNQKGYITGVPQAAAIGDVAPLVSKAAVDARVAEVIALYNSKIAVAAQNALVDGVFSSADATAVKAAWSTDLENAAKIVDCIMDGQTADNTYEYGKALLKQFPISKDIVTKALDAVNVELYYDFTYGGTSEKTAVKNALATARASISQLTITDTTNAVEAKTAVTALNTALATYEAAVASILTIAKHEAALTAVKTTAILSVQDKATALKTTTSLSMTNGSGAKVGLKLALEDIIAKAGNTPSVVVDAKAKLASLDADMAKLIAFYNAQIETIIVDADVKPVTSAAASAEADDMIEAIVAKATTAFATDVSFYTQLGSMGDVDLLIKYATDYGNVLKAKMTAAGKLEYTAATVDKAVANIIKKIRALDPAFDTYSEIKTSLDLVTKAADEATALVAYKANAVTLITVDDSSVSEPEFAAIKGKFALSNWSDERKDKVEAIQKESTKVINSVATKAEVLTEAKAAIAKMKAILTTAEVTLIKDAVLAQLKLLDYVGADSTVADPVAGTTVGTIEKYAAVVMAKNSDKAYRAGTADAITSQAVTTLYDAVLATEKADITAIEIKNILKVNYGKALSVVDGVKSEVELAAIETSIINAITALSPLVSLEVKDTILAIQKSVEDYDKLAGKNLVNITNRFVLTSAMTRVISLEKAAVDKMIADLYAKTITLADKDAVEVARAAVDAFAKAYSGYGSGTFNYGYTAITTTNLDTVEISLANILAGEAVRLIAALPDAVTYADKAVIEAARKAYDALTAVQKTNFDTVLYAKLVNAEKQLKIVADREVKNVTLKAKSTVGKGYIKISWNKAKTEVAGYEIFRSTKKYSGFGTTPKFTTKNTTYKNTAVKAGTRYYYKVRAFNVVNGEKVYSDWSTKAYRVAK